jgi:hypothetical protein
VTMQGIEPRFLASPACNLFPILTYPGMCIRSGADKSLALPASSFPICSTIKRIVLGWVKEVRTKKSEVCGDQGEYFLNR